MIKPLLLFSAALAAFAAAGGSASDDKITDLPGLPSSLSHLSMYSGYINVDESHNRNMFYWFVESQNDPANDKLVLWLNGGPGCSSVGGGLMSELGPFWPDETGTNLEANPWSWTLKANVIFLESPAGVGFSYSEDPRDYTVGDNRTTSDSYKFLMGFFERFPQYQGREFWVSGESYGGHYVPHLAKYIVDENKALKAQGKEPAINFGGFLVGNAWTDAALDNHGAAYQWLTHALISQDTFNGIINSCNLSDIGPLAAEGAFLRGTNDACDQYQDAANREMGNINIYDIYALVCTADSANSRTGTVHQHVSHFLKHIRPSQTSPTDPSDDPAGGAADYNPCVSSAVSHYLNRHDVQEAIHANTSGSLHYRWSDCSSIVHYSRYDLLTSVLPIYRDLLKSGIRMLVFSGDVDGIVPVTGTRSWLNKLSLPVQKHWRPWFAADQVGGYIVEYEGLTFATVRNAGHMVPYTQPARGYHMFSKFVYDEPLQTALLDTCLPCRHSLLGASSKCAVG